MDLRAMRNLSVDLLDDIAELRSLVGGLSPREEALAARAEDALAELVRALNSRLAAYRRIA